MIALAVIFGAVAGGIAGSLAFVAWWWIVTNRSDRGLDTGPLPALPPDPYPNSGPYRIPRSDQDIASSRHRAP